eukprot:scaffold66070_cov28-Tisochrysis_lutea.AAC.1
MSKPQPPQHGSRTSSPVDTRARLASKKPSSGSMAVAALCLRRFNAKRRSNPPPGRRIARLGAPRPAAAPLATLHPT